MLNPQGLCGQSAAWLASTLSDFDCTVAVSCRGNPANAKSIFGLMSLAAGPNSQLTFTAAGRDAHSALAAVQHLFDTKFEQAFQSQ